MSRNKMPIKAITFILSVVTVFLAVLFWTWRPARSAAKNVEMGMRYLNEYRYDEAIPFFLSALEQTPNNTQARVGLAKAYRGRANEHEEESGENRAMAMALLDSMVYTANPHPEAATEMIGILREAGGLPQALSLAQRMIEVTNEADYYNYYKVREEICREQWDVPCSFAAGADFMLCVQGGRVFARGSNALGQLGVPPENSTEWTRFQDALFPGRAVGVACAGHTSYVVAEDKTLWAAGDNLWGQMGGESGTSAPGGTWISIFDGRNVACTAGTVGRTLVLLDDGTLWTTGADSGQSFECLKRFPNIVSLAASSRFAAVLTADGNLYLSAAETPGNWKLQAQNVLSFTISETALCLLDYRGIPHILLAGGNGSFQENTSFLFPADWFDKNQYIQPLMAVKLAQTGDLTLLLSSDGVLWPLNGDGTATRTEYPAVKDIRPQGEGITIELRTGAALRWVAGNDMAETLL